MRFVFTIETLKQSACSHLNPDLLTPVKKKSKYGNKRVEFDGIKFDSQKECNRYIQLRMLLTAGEIKDLECQVPFELNEGGTYSLKYVADFRYVDVRTGETITEDVKGFRNAVYKKKYKLMQKIHGITIYET